MDSFATDAELLARSIDDPPAFSEIYRRHGVAVRRYVARRVGSDHGDHLSAEVFARAYCARARYRPDRDTAVPWLLGIATHVVADHRRLERRRLTALSRLTGREPAFVEHHDRNLSSDLITALKRLPALERDTLLLVVWGELSHDEAAAALDVPIGTVSSRIARARKRLTVALAPSRRCAIDHPELRPAGGTNA